MDNKSQNTCDLSALAEEVRDLLVLNRKTLSIAESCTGGFLASVVTSVQGASGYFMGGCITYSNESKVELLGVRRNSLEVHGAVSSVVVEEMADGIRTRLKTDYSLSVTGIAGPGGGTTDKPVGTFFVGLSSADRTFSCKYLYEAGRREIQRHAAITALSLLKQQFP